MPLSVTAFIVDCVPGSSRLFGVAEFLITLLRQSLSSVYCLQDRSACVTVSGHIQVSRFPIVHNVSSHAVLTADNCSSMLIFTFTRESAFTVYGAHSIMSAWSRKLMTKGVKINVPL